MQASFLEIETTTQKLSIEYAWVGATSAETTVIFLHEGLGSLALWKAFPHELCVAGGFRGLVYSRPGYGQSTPFSENLTLAPSFMHDHAKEVFPLVCTKLGIECAWLFGHSDGASIALIAAGLYPKLVQGLIVLAPHVCVETLTLSSIAEIAALFQTQAYAWRRAKMSQYHQIPERTFYTWSSTWLNPSFVHWCISETELGKVQCPTLAIQGHQDQYGTMLQIEKIAATLNQRTQLLKLDNCAHSPHQQHPQAVIEATQAFIKQFLNT